MQLLLATQEWDQRSPYRHQYKEVGQLYFKSKFSGVIENHPKYSRIPNKAKFKDTRKRPAPYCPENLN